MTVDQNNKSFIIKHVVVYDILMAQFRVLQI